MKSPKSSDKPTKEIYPYKLLVKSNFLHYVLGEYIEDEAEIKNILTSSYNFNVIKVSNTAD